MRGELQESGQGSPAIKTPGSTSNVKLETATSPDVDETRNLRTSASESPYKQEEGSLAALSAPNSDLAGICHICGERIWWLGRWMGWLTCGRASCVRELADRDL